jgi:TetR/AcrR family transcriptional regulator, lmrAB and yxaGH operons repressor
MAKATDSKEKTLAAATQLFRRQGFHGTALHDVLAAAGSPRGSLYFHFPGGKEQIGEAALELAGEAVRAKIALAAAASPSAAAFLTGITRAMAADLQESDFCNGCPIATTALETAAQSEVLRAAAHRAFQNWEQEVARGLERFGAKPNDAAVAATAILSQIEGALLLARTYRSIEPLRRAEAAVKLLANMPTA